MNIRRTVPAAFLIVCFATAISAADTGETKKLLVGKWEAVKVDEGSLAKGTVIEFKADGKMSIVAMLEGKDVTTEGTYTVDGNVFTAKLAVVGKEMDHKVTIKKLTATELEATNEKGKSVTFKRVK